MRFFLFLSLSFFFFHQNLQANIVGIIRDLRGIATINSENTASGIPAQNNDLVYEKHWVQTGLNGKTSIYLRDGSFIRLFEDTIIRFDQSVEYGKNREFIYIVELEKGGGLFYLGDFIEYVLIKTCEGNVLTNKNSLFYVYCDKAGKLSVNNLLRPITIETVNESAVLTPTKSINELIAQRKISDFINTPKSVIELVKGGNIKSLIEEDENIYIGVQVLPQKKLSLNESDLSVILFTSKNIKPFPIILKTNNNGFVSSSFNLKIIEKLGLEEIQMYGALDSIKGLQFLPTDIRLNKNEDHQN